MMETTAQHRDRKVILRRLKGVGYMDHREPHFFHGRLGEGLSSSASSMIAQEAGEHDSHSPTLQLQPPTVHWKSSQKPRDDHHTSAEWLTATEYMDTHPPTLEWKITTLAHLLLQSRRTVLYTGAGISRAAGIGMAARGGGDTSPKGTMAKKKKVSVTAQPTITHHALAQLHKHGHIQGGWVQQNHDGLPQKAGFPQECINEIHGSWFDPSNPVVKYSGSLKNHECAWMEQQCQTADLVIVLGTSLSGLTADQVAILAAERSKKGKSLGMVIINLQQTPQDDKTTLRIFGQSDVILTRLLQKMEIPFSTPPTTTTLQLPRRRPRRRVLVPYDRRGRRLDATDSRTPYMWWDLSVGAKVRLTQSHNLHGSHQPHYKCISSIPNPGGIVTKWRDDDFSQSIAISLEDGAVSVLLGQWWLDAAVRGGPSQLPLVNVTPKFQYKQQNKAPTTASDPCSTAYP
mmetsp:Transcript_22416/g.51656  ORF Transcript_22416/g.51656 Transcript_22416/m.51656 type:complete len:458 (+) Transcript_22416:59-1432(+)|eukprot:CAMPEP_0168842956 /NCGR_PEP_ID=MMETSP0727-20121128/7960_1 /TAXON_ID=265536 /ORGANISM="Amphiprora sp., Strain CCMP467" /LENGTH=457 /DNA_ID=CAMNT_0008896527 /DNA_START=20 /DNA_END=1393 /DNA_ORIENTATION=+